MIIKPRYLTKSRFKLACECPTKLFYTNKKDLYEDKKITDKFLLALADGGYQIGELAKYYFPDGFDIDSLDYAESLEKTNELMSQESATIYEAAVCHELLFIRVDVLKKEGKHIDLIEVKAKSFDTEDSDAFLNKNDGSLSKKWRAYLYDVAFQKYVVMQAYPDYQINASLLLVDKRKKCPVDGLNQNFRIIKDESGRRSVKVGENIEQSVAKQMLCLVSVDQYCDLIFNNQSEKNPDPLSFEDRIQHYSDSYNKDIKIDALISSACKSCEFKTDDDSELKSGFNECWMNQLGWDTEQVQRETILDLWDNRSKDKQLSDGKYHLADLSEKDIKLKEDNEPGLSRTERQWIQIEKSKNEDDDIWLDTDGLRNEMSTWKFPLHFIDFETSAPCLPFNKDRKPYEGIAFQYSHHIVDADGQVMHQGQYLNTERGIFPNYDFARSLMSELNNDDGSIFRYAAHENTYLSMIYQQLQDDPNDISDRDELSEFIKSITNKRDKWFGNRDMVDMLRLVKRYYFDPRRGGSNSIKQILPSIINRSKYLQDKYSKPIYGAKTGIPSLNFSNWAWIQKKNNKIQDPYDLLPKMFVDISEHDLELLLDDDELREGGAAMTAYSKLQFEDMSDYERQEIQTGLLKYCELDTLAMVMIYEGWRDLI